MEPLRVHAIDREQIFARPCKFGHALDLRYVLQMSAHAGRYRRAGHDQRFDAGEKLLAAEALTSRGGEDRKHHRQEHGQEARTEREDRVDDAIGESRQKSSGNYHAWIAEMHRDRRLNRGIRVPGRRRHYQRRAGTQARPPVRAAR